VDGMWLQASRSSARINQPPLRAAEQQRA